MAWTTTQQRLLAIFPKISSVLSLFGSGWIILEVLTDKSDRRKRNHPYHRLLIAMSIYDVLESVWNFFSTWPIPEGTEDVAWPKGTTATCSAQGFFLMLGVAVPIYNAMLSLYYVLVINYKVSDKKLQTWVEPSMHIIAGTWAFGTSLYAAFTGLYNNANLWCWIAPYPAGCNDSWRFPDEANCERGDNAWFYRWLFYFGPLWCSIIFATVCTLMVYRYVRALDSSTLKYRRPERFSHVANTSFISNESNGQRQLNGRDRQSMVTFANDTPRVSSESFDVRTLQKELGNDYENSFKEEDDFADWNESNHGASASGKNHVTFKEEQADDSAAATNTSSSNGSENDDTQKKELPTSVGGKGPSHSSATADTCTSVLASYPPTSGAGTPPSAAARTPQASRPPSRQLSRQRDRRASFRDSVAQWQSSRQQYAEDYKRTLEVYHQALFYLGNFYLTHGWSTANRVMQQIDKGRKAPFFLIALHSIFDPLQGYLNYFVYQRPRYLKLRKKYPKVGRIGALWRILRFSYLPEPESWSQLQDATSRARRSNIATFSRGSYGSRVSQVKGENIPE